MGGGLYDTQSPIVLLYDENHITFGCVYMIGRFCTLRYERVCVCGTWYSTTIITTTANPQFGAYVCGSGDQQPAPMATARLCKDAIDLTLSTPFEVEQDQLMEKMAIDGREEERCIESNEEEFEEATE